MSKLTNTMLRANAKMLTEQLMLARAERDMLRQVYRALRQCGSVQRRSCLAPPSLAALQAACALYDANFPQEPVPTHEVDIKDMVLLAAANARLSTGRMVVMRGNEELAIASLKDGKIVEWERK